MRRAAPAALFLIALLPTLASAQVDEERLQLMRESTSYTDVADAADGDDPFDVYLRVGFVQSRTSGSIRRELTDSTSAAGIPTFSKIGDYRRTRNVLEVGADVGIYHDLALTFRLPVVLSDSYDINGPARTIGENSDLSGAGIFDMPYRGPTRSGIDALHMGIAWAPLNQNRVHEVPSWVILLDVGVPVGPLMRPCASGVSCDGGISRGNVITHFETRISRRHRYVEPYVGLGVTAEFPTRTRFRFRPNGNLNGYQHTLPPIIGDLNVGAAFVPWENLPKFQRLVFDMRFSATYVSTGHDYSPLYDALGSSTNSNLTTPNCEDGAPQSAGCASPLVQVPFTGLTDTAAYGRFGGRVAVEVQAARYVLFSIGTNVMYQTAHAITSADICNASIAGSGAPRPGAVDCVSGVFNPHYRAIIDEPGRRFELDGSWLIDIFARITAQF